MSDPNRLLKNAFARYATGVAIVACQGPHGEPLAITINSFTSVSLQPPMVLWCLETRASLYAAFMAAPSYAVSVLGSEQQAVSTRFATPKQHGMTDDQIERRTTGAPLLKGRLAGFDCTVAARHVAGDHVILIGEVVSFDSRDGTPLLYAGRSYAVGPLVQG